MKMLMLQFIDDRIDIDYIGNYLLIDRYYVGYLDRLTNVYIVMIDNGEFEWFYKNRFKVIK